MARGQRREAHASPLSAPRQASIVAARLRAHDGRAGGSVAGRLPNDHRVRLNSGQMANPRSVTRWHAAKAAHRADHQSLRPSADTDPRMGTHCQNSPPAQKHAPPANGRQNFSRPLALCQRPIGDFALPHFESCWPHIRIDWGATLAPADRAPITLTPRGLAGFRVNRRGQATSVAVRPPRAVGPTPCTRHPSTPHATEPRPIWALPRYLNASE